MIYSVEDDTQIREMILYALRQSGFVAEGFAAAQPFWQAMAKQTPALILLDIMLPGEDGISVLRRLRAEPQTRDIPVILLTAKGAEMEKVTGLNAGADDYIAKPFSVLELVARINALLRRAKPAQEGQQLHVGAITLDEATRSVSAAGQAVPLTYKEFELLAYCMRNAGLALSRDKLLSAVWGEAYLGNTRTVDMHVKTLRQKLGAAGEQIETVRGLGYRMRRDAGEKEAD